MKTFLFSLALLLFSTFGFAQCTGFSVELEQTLDGVVGSTDLTGYHVYKLYADFENENDFLSALYALINAPENLEIISETPCYKNPFAGLLGSELGNDLDLVWPEIQYSTYLTINMENSSGPGQVLMATTTPITSAVINLEWGDITIEDGLIFTLFDQPNGFATNFKVLIGQITTQGGFTFNSCVQTFVNGTQANIQYDCFSVSAKAGCTDALASNYNPDATHDDGSCMEVIMGCIDAAACNYNEMANASDGSCELPSCSDESACNYNPDAMCFDNDVCEFVALKAIDGPLNVDANVVYEYNYPADLTSVVEWAVIGGVVSSGQGTTNISVVWDADFTGFPIGQISATETNADNCTGETVSESVNVTYVGINELNAQEITLFPNPAIDVLTIEAKSPLHNADIFVYSSVGELVMSYNAISNNLFTIQVGGLAQGFYTVVVREENSSVTLPCHILK
ncbi:MAG: T9SS type A sorting domain-containing protein [Cryomorphaceae bacterium]|nr:T9SS type A sorting domain-containing protein [Cryomorphaceae bacterium]